MLGHLRNFLKMPSELGLGLVSGPLRALVRAHPGPRVSHGACMDTFTHRSASTPGTSRRRTDCRSAEERLFVDLARMRCSLLWRCRGLVEDPKAEVDAAVWEQIVAGERDAVAIYWRTVSHLRRLKRREIRRREFELRTVSDLKFGELVATEDETEALVDRLAAEEFVATLRPTPTQGAMDWLDHMSRPRGDAPPMRSSTKMAGARWLQQVRERAEASTCAAV